MEQEANASQPQPPDSPRATSCTPTLVLPADAGVDAAVRAYRAFLLQDGDLDLLELEAAQRRASAATPLPEVGSEFLGFYLVEELGRGAFGRVYLARQVA